MFKICLAVPHILRLQSSLKQQQKCRFMQNNQISDTSTGTAELQNPHLFPEESALKQSKVTQGEHIDCSSRVSSFPVNNEPLSQKLNTSLLAIPDWEWGNKHRFLQENRPVWMGLRIPMLHLLIGLHSLPQNHQYIFLFVIVFHISFIRFFQLMQDPYSHPWIWQNTHGHFPATHISIRNILHHDQTQ